MKPLTKYLKITINILSMAVAVAFCVWLLPKIIVYFMPFVIAAIIAMIANPLVRFLEQKLKIVRKAGSIVVIVLVLGVVVFACYAIIAKLISEMVGFFSSATDIWSTISNTLRQMTNEVNILFNRMPIGVQNWFDGVFESAEAYSSEWISGLGTYVANSASNVASNMPFIIIAIIMTIIASYLFVAERDYLERLGKKFIPKHLSDRFELVYSTMKTAVGGYFKAQFRIMFFVYAVLLVGLAILQIDYAFLIALLIAILDFLPFFGTGAAMWPWALVALIQADYYKAIGLMVIWAVSQLVRQLIQPKLVSDSVGLEPIPTLLFLYVGFRVGDALGLILGVPIGLILINLYRAGVFSNFVYSIKLLLKDVSRLRVFDRADLVKEGIITQEEADEEARKEAEAAEIINTLETEKSSAKEIKATKEKKGKKDKKNKGLFGGGNKND